MKACANCGMSQEDDSTSPCDCGRSNFEDDEAADLQKLAALFFQIHAVHGEAAIVVLKLTCQSLAIAKFVNGCGCSPKPTEKFAATIFSYLWSYINWLAIARNKTRGWDFLRSAQRLKQFSETRVPAELSEEVRQAVHLLNRFFPQSEELAYASTHYGAFYRCSVCTSQLAIFMAAYLKASGRWEQENWSPQYLEDGFRYHINFRQIAPFTFYTEEPTKVRQFVTTAFVCEQFFNNFSSGTLPFLPMREMDDMLTSIVHGVSDTLSRDPVGGIGG